MSFCKLWLETKCLLLVFGLVTSAHHFVCLPFGTRNHRVVWVGRDLKDPLVPTPPWNVHAYVPVSCKTI